MRLGTLYIVLLIFVLKICVVNGQDPQLTQFYAAPLYLGPSFAGTTGHTRATINYRDQWVSLPNSFRTVTIAADHYFSKYNVGAGLLIMNDNLGGLINTTLVSSQYSYGIKVSPIATLVPGIQVSYFHTSLLTGNMVFSDQIYQGQVYPSSIESGMQDEYSNIDFGFSLLGYTDLFWLGATANHLMKLNEQHKEYKNFQALSILVYGGYTVKIEERFRIQRVDRNVTFAFNFKSQDRIQQLDIGGYYFRQPLMVGLWYRGIPFYQNIYNRDAVAFLLGLRLRSFTVSYSYDFTISNLISSTGGSHELSLIYKFDTRQRGKRRMQTVPCPQF